MRVVCPLGLRIGEIEGQVSVNLLLGVPHGMQAGKGDYQAEVIVTAIPVVPML